MVEVHSQQFEWLLEQARMQAAQLSGEDPTHVAIYWARQCGVSPRAMAKVLKHKDSYEVRQILYSLKSRLTANPWLKEVLTPP